MYRDRSHLRASAPRERFAAVDGYVYIGHQGESAYPVGQPAHRGVIEIALPEP
jgi:hypothetical protein